MQSGQQHTNSYYAASANDKPDFPVLQGDVTADVCVVGGGFIVCSELRPISQFELGAILCASRAETCVVPPQVER